MRRITTFKAKNTAPRWLIDLAVYREHTNFVNGAGNPPHWTPYFSGWSNATRPVRCPIFLRSVTPASPPPPIIM